MKNNITIPCSLSRQIFIYGLFAILCQVTFLYLHASIFLHNHSPAMLEYIYTPYLEYPLLSIAVLFGGGLIIDLIFLYDFS